MRLDWILRMDACAGTPRPQLNLRLPLLLLSLIVLFAGHGDLASTADADGELGVSIREVSVDDSALVRFLAKVVDENGRPQRLSGNSFSVRAGEQDIPVSSVETVTDAAVGVSAMLLIDTSGSMIGTPLADAQVAAAQYVQGLQPNDEVSVLSFSSQRNVIAEFSQDFPAVESQLGNLVAFGDTALYSAAGDAAQRMAQHPAARRVIIMLSDGADFGISDISREQALEAAAAGGTPFYVIGLGPTIDTAFLQELAAASGGAFFAAPSSDQLAAQFADIAELLRSEYVVTVDFAGTGIGGDTTATVRAESGDRNGEVGVSLSLPAIPVAPQVRPTEPGRVPNIPDPVQTEPAPEPEGGGSAVGVIVVLLAFSLLGLLVWWFIRRRKRRRQDVYVFSGAPAFTQRESSGEPVSRGAPPAVFRLDSGDEFRIEGAATMGIDDDNTFQLPLSRAEFGNAELRVWYSGQRYAIRDAAPRTRMRVNGRAVDWTFLADGDEIEIRGIRLRFELAAGVASTTDA